MGLNVEPEQIDCVSGVAAATGAGFTVTVAEPEIGLIQVGSD
jgi:hypothetical protein